MLTCTRQRHRRDQLFWSAETAVFAVAATANLYLATSTTAPWAWGLAAVLTLAAVGSGWAAHRTRRTTVPPSR
jgi:hypothetical protein